MGAERADEARLLQAALAPLGIVPGATDEAEGSDISPLIEDGMPGVGLSQDGTDYFDLHHTPDDTLDKVDPDALRQNVAAWTTMLAVLSGGNRAGAETARPALSFKRRNSMRILLIIPALLLAGACNVSKEGNAVTVEYDQNTAENAVSDVGNTAAERRRRDRQRRQRDRRQGPERRRRRRHQHRRRQRQ